jgi:hypothetical protein
MEKQLNKTSVTENRRKKTFTRFGEIAAVKTNPCMEGVRDGFVVQIVAIQIFLRPRA